MTQNYDMIHTMSFVICCPPTNMASKKKKNLSATFTDWKAPYMCEYVLLDSPMAERGDEIEAAVNSIVNNVSTI